MKKISDGTASQMKRSDLDWVISFPDQEALA